MRIMRPTYLSRLIAHKHNRLIKIITGIRRCGKSYLLFDFFREHLCKEGIEESHIIGIFRSGCSVFFMPVRNAGLTPGIYLKSGNERLYHQRYWRLPASRPVAFTLSCHPNSETRARMRNKML